MQQTTANLQQLTIYSAHSAQDHMMFMIKRSEPECLKEQPQERTDISIVAAFVVLSNVMDFWPELIYVSQSIDRLAYT